MTYCINWLCRWTGYFYRFLCALVWFGLLGQQAGSYRGTAGVVSRNRRGRIEEQAGYDPGCSSIRPRLFLDTTPPVPRYDPACSSIRPRLFLDTTPPVPRYDPACSSIRPRLFLDRIKEQTGSYRGTDRVVSPGLCPM